MLVTIHNDFHDTSCRVRVGRMSARNARTVHNKLCGVSGCSCSCSELGTRGSQRTDGRQIAIEPVSAEGDVEVSVNNEDFYSSTRTMPRSFRRAQ
jgi:hypothetical protein